MVGAAVRVCACVCVWLTRSVGVRSWANAKAGASKAPTAAIAVRLERKIVVLIIQRSRKVLEVIAGCAACRTLGTLRGSAASHPRAAIGVAAAAATAQHDQLTDVDLGGVPSLAVLVLPLPILDASFDVDLVALLDVLLDDVGELRSLRVPHDAAMPFGLLLAVTRRAIPRPTRRKRKARDAVSAGGGSNFRISPE